MSEGQSAGEVWISEAQILPAEEEVTSVTSTVSTSHFLRAVGATESSVSKTAKDAATIAHWQGQIAAGKTFHVTIHYDAMGNIVGADGRHRAVAALRSGLERVNVHITRRK